ncbi:MAG: hypothetical protein RL637_1221 [Pseudomonadota bacterium]|jgi:endogenous inhibitor of DNA gyrase (YacG/DUF329 family)
MLNRHQVNCPHCGQKVIWSSEARFKPFCSERCKWIDLGAWLTESHGISETTERFDDIEIKTEQNHR